MFAYFIHMYMLVAKTSQFKNQYRPAISSIRFLSRNVCIRATSNSAPNTANPLSCPYITSQMINDNSFSVMLELMLDKSLVVVDDDVDDDDDDVDRVPRTPSAKCACFSK